MDTFIAWLLSWMLGLLFPVVARRAVRRRVGESRDSGLRQLPGPRIRTTGGKPAAASAESLIPTSSIAHVRESDRTVQR